MHDIDLNTETVRNFKEKLFVKTGLEPSVQNIFGWKRNLAQDTMLLFNVMMKKNKHLLLYRKKKISNICDTSQSPFLNLPEELKYLIFQFLDASSLLVCASVCLEWKEFAQNDFLWEELLNLRWTRFEKENKPENLAWRLVYFQKSFQETNLISQQFKIVEMNEFNVKTFDSKAQGFLNIEPISFESISNSKTQNHVQPLEEIQKSFQNDCVLAYNSSPNQICISNPWSKETKKKLLGHSNRILALKFCGESHLISCDQSGFLFLWDLYRPSSSLPWINSCSNELVATKHIHNSAIGSLDLHQNYVVTGSADGTLSILDLDRSIFPCLSINAHSQLISHVAIDKYEQNFFNSVSTSSQDGFAKIWDLRNGKASICLYSGPEFLHHVEFGWKNQFFTSGESGCFIWDLRYPKISYKFTNSNSQFVKYDGSNLFFSTDSKLNFVKFNSNNQTNKNESDNIINSDIPLFPGTKYEIKIPQIFGLVTFPSALICNSGGNIVSCELFSKRRKKEKF